MSKPLKSATKTKANDLFGAEDSKGKAPLKSASRAGGAEAGYTAADIEVLEGLEPVRLRPGMYIGGTDEKALHHLFAEVIDNAMDEALAGHATFIEVDLTADGFLTVTDNGLGIPAAYQPKRFQALQRLHPDKAPGEGIGLAIVRRLLERLDGKIWVESVPGDGTVFFFTLPAASSTSSL